MSEVDQEEQAAETSLKAKWGRAGENLEASDHSLKEEGRLQQQEKMKEYDRLLNRAILITACLIVLALVIAFLV